MYCDDCGQVMLLHDDDRPDDMASYVCANCTGFAPREPADDLLDAAA